MTDAPAEVLPADIGWPDSIGGDVAAWAAATRSTAVLVTVGGRTVVDVRRAEPEPGAFGLDGAARFGADAEQGLGLAFEPFEDGRMRQDVASAQKTPAAMLVLAAAERGLLALDDPISGHLGPGWSACSPADEDRVTIRHALTMTTGLSDALTCDDPPGAVWRYSLGPIWHQVKRVVAAVTGGDLQATFDDWLGGPLGLTETTWVRRPGIAYLDGEPVEALCTTARDLTRLGRVLAGRGTVDEVEVLAPEAVDELCRPSQERNPAYGLLTWLNGRTPTFVPLVDEPLDGWLMPSGPADAVAMLGALGQLCVVVPSLDLVAVRLGTSAGGLGGAIGSSVADGIWSVLPWRDLVASPGGRAG